MTINDRNENWMTAHWINTKICSSNHSSQSCTSYYHTILCNEISTVAPTNRNSPHRPRNSRILTRLWWILDFLFSTAAMNSCKRKELDPYMRTRICELRNTAQWSYGRIHKAYPDIPLSTIKSTCQSQKKRVNNQSRPRSGRPRKDRSIERSQNQMYGLCSPTMG